MTNRTLLFVVALGGCGSGIVADGPDPEETQQIDSYIASLPYLPLAPTNVDQGEISPASSEGEYQCTSQNLSETRQYDKIVAYAANSDSLYPGALVSADSVLTGLFTQVVLPRAPAAISVSLENIGGGKSAVVADPSLSSYRDALAGILDAEITGATPANLFSEIEQVHNSTQLDMALGVQASWGGVASLKTSFDFSNEQTKSRYVVKYTQAYYTVDLDAPKSPSAVMGPSVTLADVQAKMDQQHPPAYVASVTYGRMVTFTFESNYSAEEMGAALEFAYSGGVEISGNVSVRYQDIISSSKITAFILGGDAGQAVRTIDSFDALMAFIREGGNYSKQSPGAPIAYKLNYLKDNSPARMSFTTDYDVKSCVRISQKVRVVLNAISVDDVGGDSGDALEIYGNITAAGVNSGTLFTKPEADAVHITEGQSFQAGTEVVIQVAPQAGSAISLRGALIEDDIASDDSLGNEVVLLPFETGWRKEVTMTFTGSNARVRATFSLSPI